MTFYEFIKGSQFVTYVSQSKEGDRIMKETTVEAAEAEAAESVDPTEGRAERLEKIAKNHILPSMGVGLIPFPLVDMVALFGIQLNLVKKLSIEYDVSFKQEIGKPIIASLLGGFLPASLGYAIASIIKFIPIIGQTTGAVTMPVVSGAATYAIYKVFVQHFESGGTFLDLDPVKVKSYFSEQFEKGKKIVADLKSQSTKSTTA
jgi:uncharacterized protein (DUF697 family)